MLTRATLIVVCLLILAGAASTASAISIDPALQELLDAEGKSTGIYYPVLLIFDDQIDPDELQMEIDTASPKKRRGSVISTLKKHARKSQEGAMDYLIDPSPGEIYDIEMLYFVNAIRFRGDRAAIEALAQQKGEAIMFWDRPYDDLLDRVSMTPVGESQKAIPVPDRAIAWNVTWIEANRVWNELGYTGAGILVGHIDSGVWLTHPDIVNQLWTNPGEIPGNSIDDDGNGYVDDVHGYDFGDNDGNPNDDAPGAGHGTHTAGTVAGDGTNGTQTGVAPDAQLVVAKVFDAAGTATLGAVWNAQQYLVENGARVMTISLGIKGDDIPESYHRAERYNANNIRAAGVLVFNSAGNEHYTYSPPNELNLASRVPSPWFADPGVPFSSTSGIMAIGGTAYMSNGVYTFSSRGPAKWDHVAPWHDWPYNPGTGLTKPDVTAPGTNVNSLTIPAGYSGDSWSGTSMSCPHVAGVAALMLEKNPSLSPTTINRILEETAHDLGTAGKDNTFGSGIVDAYDAVVAVSMDQVANLIQTGYVGDPSGDGVLDPGESNVQLLFELTNNSPVVDATGVTADLIVRPNAHVTLTDSEGSYANIPMGGGTALNSADPFVIDIGAGAPQGYEFVVDLTVYADNGFERNFDITLEVGLPEFLTHNIGNVYLTVTDQGIIGFMSDQQLEGAGMGVAGEGSALFVSSLWAGNSADYICAREYSGNGGSDNYEWEVATSPNGRMRDLGAAGSDQTFESLFTDSGAVQAKDVSVRQRSFAWSAEPDNDFVIMEYEITNNGTTSLSNYRTGIFCDWDIGSAAANEGGTDTEHEIAYVYAAGGAYFGVTVVSDTPVDNLTMVKNETYVYPNARIDDGFKMRFLSGVFSTPSSDGPNDWSAVTSAGPFQFAPDDVITVAYAMVYGENLADLLTNAEAAQAAYSPDTPVSQDVPVKVFKLTQNQPNPFNPATEIKFTVATPGHVELAVYDTQGRLINTLLSETRDAGEHSVGWNGTDAQGNRVPSGVYFCKYFSGGETATQKMTLLK